MTQKPLLRAFVLVLVNLVLVLALLEVGLRVLAPQLGGQLGVAARYATFGTPYAQDWQPAWQQNRDHYYSLLPNVTDSLQYGSPNVSFRLTTTELWEGAGIGFRTRPVDFFVDAVVVGDSFGMCFTEQEDCWVELLAQERGLNIVNLSQPVTGSTSHYRILRDFGKPLTPPLVIWQFFGNDFNDDYGLALLNKEVETLDTPPASPEDNTPAPIAWLRRNSAAFAVLETLFVGQYLGTPATEDVFVKPLRVTFGATNEHALAFGGLYEQQALDMTRPANQYGLTRSREAFAQAQTLSTELDAQLLVVLIPTREEVYAHLTAPLMGQGAVDSLAGARRAMLALCEEQGLRCYDAHDMLLARALADEALYYEDDMHLNPHGNAVLAAWLAGILAENAP